MSYFSLTKSFIAELKQSCVFNTFAWGRLTHRQQHTLALLDGSAAAQETDDEQKSTYTYEHVADAGQMVQLRRSVVHFFQYTQQGRVVHLHPNSHTQDDCTCQLSGAKARKAD